MEITIFPQLPLHNDDIIDSFLLPTMYTRIIVLNLIHTTHTCQIGESFFSLLKVYNRLLEGSTFTTLPKVDDPNIFQELEIFKGRYPYFQVEIIRKGQEMIEKISETEFFDWKGTQTTITRDFDFDQFVTLLVTAKLVEITSTLLNNWRYLASSAFKKWQDRRIKACKEDRGWIIGFFYYWNMEKGAFNEDDIDSIRTIYSDDVQTYHSVDEYLRLEPFLIKTINSRNEIERKDFKRGKEDGVLV